MGDGSGPPPVGYKRPPLEHRFRKGQSGNPKGRPRKASGSRGESGAAGLSADDLLLDEAYRPIQVREADQVRSMPALTAVYRSAVMAAVKGDRHARKLLTDAVRDVEARKQAEWRETIEIVADYKERCHAAFRDADAHGQPRPELLPHPDDIVFGADGWLRFVGPKDAAHKAAWDKARGRIAEAEAEIERCRQEARRHPRHARFLHDEITYAERLKRLVDYQLPDEATRRRHGYCLPTREMTRAHHAALKTRFRLFAELSPEEQEQALQRLVPTGRARTNREGDIAA